MGCVFSKQQKPLSRRDQPCHPVGGLPQLFLCSVERWNDEGETQWFTYLWWNMAQQLQVRVGLAPRASAGPQQHTAVRVVLRWYNAKR